MEGLLKTLILSALSAFFGSLLFAMSLKAPKKSVFVAGIAGLAGQVFYTLLCDVTGIYFAVFVATLVAGILAEIGSRIVKTPATVIAYPALIPLVPGVMLFRAMLAFSQSEIQEGATQLISAIMYTGCMAVAITFSAVAAKQFLAPLFKKHKENK